MTDYKKLVEALRYCTSSNPDDCDICEYQPFCQRNGTGRERIMIDAAAAIEALQAEVDALKHDIERYVQMNTELLNDRPELEEIGGKWVWKEPKRGKWKPFDLTWGRSIYSCTACGESADVPTANGKALYKYCPNCGAKMEVQDG